ncbi:tRNA preQ1(34) S-adenosylmethionine ribosyltransferase-isomerase QueA [Ferroacidibacillus organovorans]|uniref:S-adenosylmethionine:tRNA ribosyltransferase-isomerase n=1 Tax=Ferroacidibacillus organovorans TaxID=1765683 RepID=A0A101XP46_9BACL|nr:tRNA preQ1(34) S-adenosylmethionine ribosyltransferase-isomerase QueA [Ferroacidibacillus organovorans]KUO94841.1 S-adenosylmethionine:tRNA ribosyltransferase-isomerase [Ferroacidibacillus organovorans]
MKTEDFDYELPAHLIAQTPLEKRSDSRLLVLNRKEQTLAHARFYELGNYLRAGDLLIFNDSRVIPARLFGEKEGTGGAVELLLLRPLQNPVHFEALVKPGRRIRSGQRLRFGGGALTGTVIGEGQDGVRHIAFDTDAKMWDALLETLGEMPLPPYIHERLEDRTRYQTVYAREKGSAAAPTAGLHFTDELLSSLAAQGVERAFVTLHVGLGTFRPVQVEDVEKHTMHAEWFRIPAETKQAIERAKAEGRRVICVGTTSVRTIESAWRNYGTVAEDGSIQGFTDIFIHPNEPLRVTEGLITNFHLPQSTLMMLVAALIGRERLLETYRIAVEHEYRFFSFGDAMLIL